MYMDIVQWKRVRALVLQNGISRKVVSQTENIDLKTLRKMLLYKEPPGYRYATASEERRPGYFLKVLKKNIAENQLRPESTRLSSSEIFQSLKKQGYQGSLSLVYHYRRQCENKDEAHLWETVQHIVRELTDDEGTKFLSSLFPKGTLTSSTNASSQRRKKIRLKSVNLDLSQLGRESVARRKWEHWLSEIERTGKYDSQIFRKEETLFLMEKVTAGKNSDRKKALVFLAQDQEFPVKYLGKFLGLSLTAIYSYAELLNTKGVEGSFLGIARKKKEDNEEIKKTVFSLLHEPPSLSGLNRTSWRISDLEKILKEKGIIAGPIVLRKIIKKSGFRWKAARVVLTSRDPNYREKLSRVQNILGNLQDNERFFSIDEFGPFSVNMKSGYSLKPPGVQTVVPQFQKSKGVVICTAALELSRNQVTHFFSDTKNSAEMIKLATLLSEKYSYVHKLYLSWDAASWHKSRSLGKFVEQHNEKAISENLPIIEIVTLPAGAQFLNVIESVFSGMAKSVIHNSDYPSKEAAMHAIDRYFSERNQHYIDHPKAAGKKIWGMERTSNTFAPENNCKDPAFH